MKKDRKPPVSLQPTATAGTVVCKVAAAYRCITLDDLTYCGINLPVDGSDCFLSAVIQNMRVWSVVGGRCSPVVSGMS